MIVGRLVSKVGRVDKKVGRVGVGRVGSGASCPASLVAINVIIYVLVNQRTKIRNKI